MPPSRKILKVKPLYRNRAGWLLLFVMFAFAPSSNAQVAASDRETAGLAAEQAGQLRLALDDYVAALQALPDPPPADADQRLRERIIKLALKLDPPPAVPDEAQQRMTRGQTASKSAQKPEELKASLSEFQRALRMAPWLAGGYSNLGELQEKLRDYPAAIRSFELYLLAAPTAQDAESVQKRINDLRGRFDTLYMYAHHFGSGDYVSGELTVSNGWIQFRDRAEAKYSFTFPVSDVRSVERRAGPIYMRFLRALHIELRNGKRFVLVALFPGDEGVVPIEKAIKDMDSEHRIVFK
jgi:tetratricopeptide (TPR) repeat protein